MKGGVLHSNGMNRMTRMNRPILRGEQDGRSGAEGISGWQQGEACGGRVLTWVKASRVHRRASRPPGGARLRNGIVAMKVRVLHSNGMNRPILRGEQDGRSGAKGIRGWQQGEARGDGALTGVGASRGHRRAHPSRTGLAHLHAIVQPFRA